MSSMSRAALAGGASPVALGLVLFISMGAVSTASAPVGHGEDIDWRTSPLDLNLRGLNGERFQFQCPPGKPAPGQVVGSGPYADGSSICAAAVHAGALRSSAGGLVTIEVRPGQSHYSGSMGHYVRSESYEAFWSGSFLIVTDAAERPSSAPSSLESYDLLFPYINTRWE